MNGNDLNNSTSQKETYHATTNLNIDIENPQINMNSAVGVNIKGNDHFADDRYSNTDYGSFSSFDPNVGSNVPNSSQVISDVENNILNTYRDVNTSMEVNSNLNGNPTQFVPTMESNYSNSNQTFLNSDQNTYGEKTVYEPTMEEKKQKGQMSSVFKEFKVTIFIIFLLLIFILLMPYVYDFFKNLELTLTR